MSIAEQLAKADELHVAEKVDEMNSLLEPLAKENPENPQVLFRYARCLYLVGKNKYADNKEERGNCMKRGLKLVEQAYQLEKKANSSTPDKIDFQIPKWYGIMFGAQGEFIDTKEKIGNAFKIKDLFQEALTINKDDATTWNALGQWHYSVSSVSSIEKAAASVLFATPPSSTYSEAEMHFRKSLELRPDDIETLLRLGETLYQQSKYDEAKKYFELCAKQPTPTEHAKRMVADAVAKAQKCSSWW